MKLRTRLILVLLVLSVAPLAAVTIYSYVNNLHALRETAAREADLLAGELSARMELVTAELSDRVERLMEMPAPAAVVASAKPKPAPSAVPAVPAVATPSPEATADATAAEMLGEAAMLLERVDITGVGRGGRGVGGGTGANSARGQRQGGQPVNGGSGTGTNGSSSTAPAGERGTTPASPPATTAAGTPTVTSTDAGRNPNGQRPARGDRAGVPSLGNRGQGANASATPPTVLTVPSMPVAPASGTTPASPAPPPPASPNGPRGQRQPPPPLTPLDTSKSDDNHVVIDMAPIIREMAQKMSPQGSPATWTPEMRVQFSREMGERMTGIQEGIRLSVAELQKKAQEAKDKADQSVTTTDQAAAPAASATHRKSALAGNRLDVTVEHNGQVRTANAQINLDNVLLTVFSTTKRDLGEVPFAVAKDGKLYTRNDADKAIVQGFGAVVSAKGTVGRTILPAWVVVTTLDPTGSGLRFGIARPVGDSVSELRKTAGRNAGLGLLFIALAIAGVVPISQRLTRNLSSLTDGVQRIARGDLGARVAVVSPHDEIGVLAAAVNQMAEDLEKHQHALVGQERLKRELELGRQIQNEMLPHEPLRFGLTEVKGVSVPAREVGGDFFNYFALPSREVALLVGDVSGKGVGAALVMANIQSALRTRLALDQDLPAIADAIDRDMDTGAARSAYATLFVGILNPITKRLRYVNAGHHPQYVLRATGSLERMNSTGLPIGLLSGRHFTQGDVQLATGDLLFFYTDGIVEAEDESGEFFGAEGIEAAIVAAREASGDLGIDDVLSRVERSVSDFRQGREPFDDATMMAVRIG